VQIPGGASGFSAGATGTINVSLNGGAPLVWGSTPNFNPSALVLNQPSALGTLDFQNAIDLNGAARTFAGNGPITNPGVVSAPITSTGGPVAVTIGNGGGGVVQFTNTGNTAIASLTLTSGELGISSHDNINGTTTPITFNGGGLQVNGTAIATFPDAHPVTYVASKPIGFDVTTAAHTLTVPSSFPTTTTTFTKNGAGTLALTAASNQFVTLQMNGGTLDLGSGTYTIANGGANIIQSTGGGTINATGGGTLALSSLNATDGGNIGTANGTTLTINARIASTTGAFETFTANNGTGVIVVTGNNTFTGDVFINSNVLSVPSIGNSGTAGPLGQGSTINIANSTTTTGTLRYTGTGETNNRVLNLRGTTAAATVEMAGTGTLTFTSNVTATGAGIKTLNLIGSTGGIGEIAGIIPNNSATNTTSITKNGTGTWKLSGANTFTGGVTVTQGNLIITNSSALGTGTKTITLNNGTAGTPQLFLDGSAGDITLPNTFTYLTSVNTTATSGAFVNVAGNNTIQGTINLTAGGGDTGIVVNGGSLTIAANVSTVSTGLGTRNLRLRGVASGALSGVITNGSSTVGIIQEGTGTWAITGNSNTYTSATSITSGTLLANNISGSATGGSTVTVSGTGTLGGSGFITGPVAVNAGGTIAPGNSPGILSIGNATFGGGTFALELNGITPGTGYDQLNVTGTVSLTADSPISISLGFTPSNNQTFIVLSNDGADPISTAGGLFTNAGFPLSEGAIFTASGQQFSITYAGGDGNDVAVVAVPEPGAFGAILSCLGLIAGLRRRRA
jgi:autotransporter-associated beta strand protein